MTTTPRQEVLPRPKTYKQRLKTLQQRFEEKVIKSLNCWKWTGASKNGGYGMIYFDGPALKKLRLEKGMSLATLAKKANCSAPYIFDIERNHRTPSEKMAKKIIESLK